MPNLHPEGIVVMLWRRDGQQDARLANTPNICAFHLLLGSAPIHPIALIQNTFLLPIGGSGRLATFPSPLQQASGSPAGGGRQEHNRDELSAAHHKFLHAQEQRPLPCRPEIPLDASTPNETRAPGQYY